ncbi:tetratricopeptide repeat protein [Streptomyces sp. NBC_01334]|uniref:tetratricopeptide repeat protein n=1 Tax=Streptomyces sp. NBC_01334 TaxID=2903827 RepID=UPI002E149F46|nr:tetratricopeptide repeat protein [Streptomyces sp. NBC_01334]
MERESEELAVWAAEVLNRGLLSENREEIRRAFVEWFVRHGGAGSVPAQITSPFDGSDGSDGSEETLVEVEGRHFEAWLLSGKGGALTDLFELIDRFEQTPWLPEPTPQRADPTARSSERVPQVSEPAAQLSGHPARSSERTPQLSERTPQLSGPAAPLSGPAALASSGDAVGYYGGNYHGPVVGVLNQHTYATPPGVFVVPDPAGWPTVEGADLVTLGVRPAGRRATGPGLPPYVPRDLDETLRGWTTQDRLLVITGGPLTGKSRTAWAAVVRETEPGTRVYAPAPGTDLRGLPALLRGRDGAYVLWLDELEGHLGEHGLTVGLLAELRTLGVPVVATMGDDAYDTHRFGGGPASRLMTLARSERVSSGWSEQEVERLTGLRDDRLGEALDRRGATGVTQYLAIGAELRAQWQRAGRSNSRHPYGYLLIRAATDLARCGVTGDIPRRLLEETCRSYGAGRSAGRPDAESFQEAVDWAVQPLHGVTGMLVPGAPLRVGESEETWRPYGSLVADMEQEAARAVPEAVWRCALEGTKYDAGVHLNVRATADILFSARARDGDAGAMHMLSLLSENEATALDWLRKAVDAGKKELAGQVGERLLGQGEAEEALPYLRVAAEAKPDGPQARLVGEAHLALAEQWLRKAVADADMAATHRLGDLLLGRGDLSEAMDHYIGAEMQGYTPVARSAAVSFLLSHEEEAAEVLLARAAADGDEGAAELLADIRKPRQSLDDAAGYFAGDGRLDATHQAVVAEKMGLPEEARQGYEQGHARGDAYAAYRLALLLEKQDNPAEATLWYRKAADMGHPAARKALAERSEDTATVRE